MPKAIRDRLGLDAGMLLDFRVLRDTALTARAVRPNARGVRGIPKSPHQAAMTVEQMDAGTARHLQAKHLPPTTAGRRRRG